MPLVVALSIDLSIYRRPASCRMHIFLACLRCSCSLPLVKRITIERPRPLHDHTGVPENPVRNEHRAGQEGVVASLHRASLGGGGKDKHAEPEDQRERAQIWRELEDTPSFAPAWVGFGRPKHSSSIRFETEQATGENCLYMLPRDARRRSIVCPSFEALGLVTCMIGVRNASTCRCCAGVLDAWWTLAGPAHLVLFAILWWRVAQGTSMRRNDLFTATVAPTKSLRLHS